MITDSMSFSCSAWILSFSVVNCLGTIRLHFCNAVTFLGKFLGKQSVHDKVGCTWKSRVVVVAN